MVQKIFGLGATFFPFFTIHLCVSLLSGCVQRALLPEERFLRAERFIDAGTRFLRQRDLQGARRYFELAAELAPVAAAVDGQGCVALYEGRFEDAERLFKEAYMMDGRYDEALVHLGFTRELQGYSEDAQGMYLEYLVNYPDSAGVRNNLAALEYDQGTGTMRAVEALEKAITLSDQAVIRENLAILSKK